jgi:hypothetical protein
MLKEDQDLEEMEEEEGTDWEIREGTPPSKKGPQKTRIGKSRAKNSRTKTKANGRFTNATNPTWGPSKYIFILMTPTLRTTLV